jgi:hypothetical protein
MALDTGRVWYQGFPQWRCIQAQNGTRIPPNGAAYRLRMVPSNFPRALHTGSEWYQGFHTDGAGYRPRVVARILYRWRWIQTQSGIKDSLQMALTTGRMWYQGFPSDGAGYRTRVLLRIQAQSGTKDSLQVALHTGSKWYQGFPTGGVWYRMQSTLLFTSSTFPFYTVSLNSLLISRVCNSHVKTKLICIITKGYTWMIYVCIV